MKFSIACSKAIISLIKCRADTTVLIDAHLCMFIWFSEEGDVPEGSPNVGGGYRVSKINQTTSKRLTTQLWIQYFSHRASTIIIHLEFSRSVITSSSPLSMWSSSSASSSPMSTITTVIIISSSSIIIIRIRIKDIDRAWPKSMCLIMKLIYRWKTFDRIRTLWLHHLIKSCFNAVTANLISLS